MKAAILFFMIVALIAMAMASVHHHHHQVRGKNICYTIKYYNGVEENFEITEELACMRYLKGTTKECDIFRELQEGLLTLKNPITNICIIMTNRAPDMAIKLSGFLRLFNQNYPRINVVFLHCVICQDALSKSALNMKPVLDAVLKLVNTL
ncbi:general transcription factor II-I repeat domain-containing protein 2A [Nephila pilipes]|uniref:General transcription factor II-I repeat domain-containing protein 2A n=1 Tax=Nephila pilipes TaxID=299642 RepID=A0A8X6QLD3_NEPPI|nr:general transcription factor II-I repeat domain-containing protein 2A [Nephila pilipes]